MYQKINFGSEESFSEFTPSFGSRMESEAFQIAGARGKERERALPGGDRWVAHLEL